jgi:hypothetical protein
MTREATSAKVGSIDDPIHSLWVHLPASVRLSLVSLHAAAPQVTTHQIVENHDFLELLQ